jgi:hypothetical protein
MSDIFTLDVNKYLIDFFFHPCIQSCDQAQLCVAVLQQEKDQQVD